MRESDEGLSERVTQSGSFASILCALAATPVTDIDSVLFLRSGDRVGEFIVQQKIGAGGMGVVYRADDPQLERLVAIKVHRGLGRRSPVEAMLSEAKSMAQLTHPNVLTIYEVGMHDEHVFIAMEYAQGGSLREWLCRGSRPWREVVSMFVAAGRGLVAAHALNIVHRDFKADNVLLDSSGRPRVADFGLAHSFGGEVPQGQVDQETRPKSVRERAEIRITSMGTAVGTPCYMPPEQYGVGEVTPLADQFAFCASLYEALYHQLPFVADTMLGQLSEISRGRIQRVPSTRVPKAILSALKRGMAADPHERYPSMNALLNALTVDRSASRRRLAGLGAMAVIAGGAGLLWAAEPAPDLCAQARKTITTTWHAERRSDVQAAYDGLSGANITEHRDHALSVMDQFAQSWTDSRVDACQATRVRGEQSGSMMDLRFACLERRRATFEGIARTLVAVDDSVAQRTENVLRGLPLLASCSDLEALQQGIDPPLDASTVDRVAQLRAQLAEVVAGLSANKVKGARVRMEALVLEAAEVGYAPVRVEALYTGARVDDDLGDYAASREGFEATMLLAIELGYHEYIPLAAALLAFNVGYRVNDEEVAGRILKWARAADARTPSTRAQILIEGTAATLAWKRGDPTAAVTAAKRALDLRITSESGDETLAWSERNRYAKMLARAGHPDQAREQIERGIALLEERFGRDDARLVSPLRLAAVFETTQGQWTDAIRIFERRVSLVEHAHGLESLLLVEALRLVSESYGVAGDVDAATRTLRRAFAVYARLPSPDSVEYGELLAQRGSLRTLAGDCVGAIAAFESAAEAFELALGPNSRPLARSLGHKLECVTKVHGAVAAARTARELLAVHEGFFGPGSLNLLPPLTHATQAAGRAALDEETILLADRGLALLKLHRINTGVHFVYLLADRGQSKAALGREAQASADFEAALQAMQVEPLTDRLQAEMLGVLGRLLYAFPDSKVRAYAAAVRSRELAARSTAAWADRLRARSQPWFAEHPQPSEMSPGQRRVSEASG